MPYFPVRKLKQPKADVENLTLGNTNWTLKDAQKVKFDDHWLALCIYRKKLYFASKIVFNAFNESSVTKH